LVAENSIGTGTPSNTVAIYAIVKPDSPTDLSLDDTYGGVLSISWTPPVDTGGSSINYRLYYADFLSDQFDIAYEGQSVVKEWTCPPIDSSQGHERYWFKVSAYNAVGESSPSAISTFI
jgi:hypothetical protein